MALITFVTFVEVMFVNSYIPLNYDIIEPQELEANFEEIFQNDSKGLNLSSLGISEFANDFLIPIDGFITGELIT